MKKNNLTAIESIGAIFNWHMDIPLSSVAGTPDRPVKADFVQRRLEDRGSRVRYVYSATTTADNAVNAITTRILDSLVDAFGAVAIENFFKYKNKK